MKKQNEIEEKEDINNNSQNIKESENLFMNQMKKEIEIEKKVNNQIDNLRINENTLTESIT